MRRRRSFLGLDSKEGHIERVPKVDAEIKYDMKERIRRQAQNAAYKLGKHEGF